MIVRIIGLILLGFIAATVLGFSGQLNKTDRTLENVLTEELAATIKVQDEIYEVVVLQGSSVFDAMEVAQEQGFLFAGKDYMGMGFFVEEINGIQQTPQEKMYWIYSVNGEKAQVGVSSYVIEDNDVITFTYEGMEE